MSGATSAKTTSPKTPAMAAARSRSSERTGTKRASAGPLLSTSRRTRRVSSPRSARVGVGGVTLGEVEGGAEVAAEGGLAALEVVRDATRVAEAARGARHLPDGDAGRSEEGERPERAGEGRRGASRDGAHREQRDEGSRGGGERARFEGGA